VKSYRRKDYDDRNDALAWENLCRKSNPISIPSLMKTNKLLSESKLHKKRDPESFITNLDGL
jgi:hypothetical protein